MIASLADRDHPHHVDHGVSPGFGVALVWRLQSVPNGGDSIGAVDAWEFLMIRNAGIVVGCVLRIPSAEVVLVLVMDASSV